MPISELERRMKQADTLRAMIKRAGELEDHERVSRLRDTLKETEAVVSKLRAERREQRPRADAERGGATSG